MAPAEELVSARSIEVMIVELRERRVLLDTDLARMYGVETRALVQAVQRNVDRFPSDFMFRLSAEEWARLKTERTRGRGGRRTLPLAFTQEGVAMLSSVLRSEKAVAVNVEVMRAFVRMREIVRAHQDLVRRLDDLEARYDSQFAAVFSAIRQLMLPPAPKRNPVGFTSPEPE